MRAPRARSPSIREPADPSIATLSVPQSQPTLPLVLALAMLVSYVSCGLVASAHYPVPYGPWHNNTLSQLGNPHLNPHGAAFYLLGCAVTGALAIAFFLSLSPWKRIATRRQVHLVRLMQILGAVGGFGLIMNAVYPENQLQLHHFWAGVVFNSLGAAMAIAPFALRRPGFIDRGLLVIPTLGALSVVTMFVFARTHWVEWLPVALFLLAPAYLGWHTRASHRTRVYTANT